MPEKSRRRKSTRKSRNFLNRYFDKIFVINLYDKVKRWNKVQRQFKNRKIDVERFIAIDGRCKDQGKTACLQKLKSFELTYRVKISNPDKYPLKELVPASSLTIGTILLLRAQVRNKWKHMLVCEDDIELGRNFLEKFKQGVREIGRKKWDLLYLGCGHECGNKGISEHRTSKNKRKSTLMQFYPDINLYVQYKNDLRMMCDHCEDFSEHISVPTHPGGTWCYAYSLEGARKMLKLLDDEAGNHIDQLLTTEIYNENMTALSFNPPIVMHEDGAFRKDTDIPWKY